MIMSLKYQPLLNRKGFLLFIIPLVLLTVAIFFSILMWLSKSRALISQKSYEIDIARGVCDGALDILVQAIHNQTPLPQGIREFNSIPHSSFVHYFGQVELNETFQAGHSRLMSLTEHQYRHAFETLEKSFPGVEIECNLQGQAEPHSEFLVDPISRQVEFELRCRTWYASVKVDHMIKKKVWIYNMASEAYTRFTIFHHDSVGGSYNKTLLDGAGRVINNMIPLIAFNHNPKSDKSDNELLALKKSEEKRSFDRLTTSGTSKKLKHAIEDRGYQYYGNSQFRPTDLRIGGGMRFETYSEEWLLFNPYYEKFSPVYKLYREFLPPRLQSQYRVTNLYEDPDGDVEKETSGWGLVKFWKGGFWNISKDHPDYPGKYIGGWTPFSSAIHPFGTIDQMSRTRIIGNTIRTSWRVSKLFLDRVASESDERQYERCMGYDYEMTPENSLISPLPSLPYFPDNSFPSSALEPFLGYKGNIVRECDEPTKIKPADTFIPQYLFEKHDEYSRASSGYSFNNPLQLIDMALFSHDDMPPHFNKGFQGYTLIDDDRERGKRDKYEIDAITGEAFERADGSGAYFRFDYNFLNPDVIQRKKIYMPALTVKELEDRGYLRANSWVGPEIPLKIVGDLEIGEKFEFQSRTSLYVDGHCKVSPVRSRQYLLLNCKTLEFTKKQNFEKKKEVNIYEGIFVGRNGIRHTLEHPDSLVVHGTLAGSPIEDSFFSIPTMVVYDSSNDYRQGKQDNAFRAMMEPSILNWEIKP